MEIKNKLTVTRREGDNGGKKGKNHKGHMDKDNGGGIECGRWG